MIRHWSAWFVVLSAAWWFGTAASLAAWEWMSPLPQGHHLNAIWGIAPDSWLAVGDSGTVIWWEGTDWIIGDSGVGSNLRSVWGATADDVFAVGDGGVIIHWDGSAWAPMISGTTVRLMSVWGADSGNVFVVGDNGTILRCNGAEWRYDS